MFTYKFLLISFWSTLGLTNSERDHFKNDSAVIILNDTNFDNITGLGANQNASQPWFIMFYASWCPHCKRIIPVWEQLALDFEGKVKIGALECEDNQDIRDRISISGFPSLIYFSTDNKMYKYNGKTFTKRYLFLGFRNLQNFSQFLQEEEWNKLEAQEIPKEINVWKRFFRHLLSPWIVISVIGIMILSLLACITMEERKQNKRREIQMRERDNPSQKFE